ncbi:YceI family protein [Flavobacterium sp. H122]|uniref:YceI family protein n=1 Tax=Flavobacterium sp. H122 TaxID=2529860 RepID=UPI0010AA8557|nr:YceI family protein [Flavobacterium sp. H122]
MKTLVFFLLGNVFLSGFYAQDKILTKTGTTVFEASVPSFEEVKATNKNSGCILNTNTGEIVGLILIKGFKFRLALMEEHFNENYMESSKYPKAVFKGKVTNFNWKEVGSTPQQYDINGTMEIHGKSKEITIQAKIYKKEDATILTSDFILNTDDYNIELPLFIRSKVAKKVNVTINYQLR